MAWGLHGANVQVLTHGAQGLRGGEWPVIFIDNAELVSQKRMDKIIADTCEGATPLYIMLQ